MAIKRRFRRRRKFNKRRISRRSFVPRSINVLTTKRTFLETTITCSSFKAGGMSFSLDLLPSYTEFTALFQMYKICAIKIKWLPTQTMVPSVNTYWNNTASLAEAYYPDIRAFRYALDFTNITPPSLNDLLQYSNVKEFIPVRKHTTYFKPKIAVAAYTGSVFTGYMNTKGWIDTVSSNIQHYGLRYAWPFGNGTPQITPQITMYMKFKYSR